MISLPIESTPRHSVDGRRDARRGATTQGEARCTMRDPVPDLLDEAIAARRRAAILSRRRQREELALQEFKEEFGKELDDAYAATTPSESTCNLYFKLFREFAEWLRTDNDLHFRQPALRSLTI